MPLDNCFADWNESALIQWPDRRVEIHAGNCRYLHVYALRDAISLHRAAERGRRAR